MTRKVIHVALNGVTGRMGYRQHLVRSLLAIREQGGVRLEDGTTLYPEPILVGRDTDRLRAIAERHGLQRWTTDLHEVLADPAVEVYFDTQVTSAREVALLKAIEAGKHVYTEKPVATSLDGALRLAHAAKAAGITHGVVHDKLFLPGVMKLQRLMHEDFFGRVLSVRLEFASGAFASVNSSWTVRVNRRELLELQVDGTDASAVAGLRDCAVQHRVSTPMPVWNPDLPDPIDYQALWSDVPDNMTFDNGFKVEWELFLKCAWQGRPFAWDLVEGAKGVQLADLALQSSAQGRRLDVPPLAV